jgi:hypothetical protein
MNKKGQGGGGPPILWPKDVFDYLPFWWKILILLSALLTVITGIYYVMKK